MSSPTLAILMPGAMGAAMGARLTHAGCTVLTSLAGRSPSSADRARAAGMRDAPLADIVREADWILSVLPPSEVLSLARELRGVFNSVAASRAGRRLVFVDANAIAPATMHEVRAAWAGAPGVVVLDGGIIGGPPSAPDKEGEAYNPTLYTVADADDVGVLAEFVELGNQHGLKIVPLEGEGAGVGDASALKMSYAGIQKGLTGLMTTMILAAHASSPATASALLSELSQSQSQLLARSARSIPDMLPKAYRFSGEMAEISSFVASTGGSGNIHRGMQEVYERVERSLQEGKDGGEEVRVLREWVARAKKAGSEGHNL